MEQKIPWNLLAKSFAGESTASEEEELEAWVQADPAREELIQNIFEIWRQTGNLYEVDVDHAWKRTQFKMEAIEKEEERLNTHATSKRMDGSGRIFNMIQNSKQRRSVGRSYRIAVLAATTLLAIMSSLFFTYQNIQDRDGLVEEVAHELVSNEGEWASYSLQDGSRIVLHAGSKLTVPINFNRESRSVHLQGEAFFEVVPDPDKPFLVETEQTYTRVLGTSFLVQAWSDRSDEVEVVVVEGSVAFGGKASVNTAGNEAEMTLTRNQSGVFITGHGLRARDIKDMEWYLGWTKGRLVFNDKPFHEIIPRLERWYAVTIKTPSLELDKRRLTAEIDYSSPMKEVLKGIALSLDLEVTIEDRLVTFHLNETG